MNLSEGICFLCVKESKIIASQESAAIFSSLPDILPNSINGLQLCEVTSKNLNMCPPCLGRIVELAEYRNQINGFCESQSQCSLCKSYKYLVDIKDWTHFDNLLQNIQAERYSQCSVCIRCILYLDLLETMKVNFYKKYSQLSHNNSTPNKKIISIRKSNTPKRGFSKNASTRYSSQFNLGSNSDWAPTDSKKMSTLKNLKPLNQSKINIDDDLKWDDKLLNQIVSVNISGLILRDCKSHKNKKRKLERDALRKFTARHSYFKIKLKEKLSPNKAKKLKPTPQNQLLNKSNNKELRVNLRKLDISTLKRIESSTKASCEDWPSKDSFSSSKKLNKHVSFSRDLPEEQSAKKDHVNASPLKYVLKKVMLTDEALSEQDKFVTR